MRFEELLKTPAAVFVRRSRGSYADRHRNCAHSNDSSFDPYDHSNAPYEKLKPVR